MTFQGGNQSSDQQGYLSSLYRTTSAREGGVGVEGEQERVETRVRSHTRESLNKPDEPQNRTRRLSKMFRL